MTVLSPRHSSLREILERVLEKGVAVDARVRVSLGCADLLGARCTLMLSSFEAAAKTGLALPEEINTQTPAWQALLSKRQCPVCGMESKPEDLEEEGCPWCGWNYRPEKG